MDSGRRREHPKEGKGSPRCPSCDAPLAVEVAPAAPFRPFCSERCKLTDLGKWLGGAHAIPGEAVALDDEI